MAPLLSGKIRECGSETSDKRPVSQVPLLGHGAPGSYSILLKYAHKYGVKDFCKCCDTQAKLSAASDCVIERLVKDKVKSDLSPSAKSVVMIRDACSAKPM